MVPATRNWFLSVCTALAFVAASANASDAGWVTISNDTNRVLVVQTSTGDHGRVKRCKPVRLLPGESLREFYSPPSLSVDVYDGTRPNAPLASSSIGIRADNQSFSLTSRGQSVAVVPAPRR